MSKLAFFAVTRRTMLAAAVTLAITGCATPPAPATLAATLDNTAALSTLNDLVARAGLTNTLKTDGPFTVLAPTNDAFKAVPAATMDELAKDPEKLKAVLTYHLIPGKVMAADVKNSTQKTVNGASVALSKAGDFVTIESAAVVSADIAATNGVVHTIDAVLLPPKKK